MKPIGLILAVAFALFCGGAAAVPVTHSDTTVNGVAVDRYQWRDSNNRVRSVSLKKEGNGNPGHGGYAVQMTYQALVGGVLRNVIVNANPTFDGGFGYFVSHERYRDFTDGTNGTIAGKVFGTDDSPLGLRFAVVGARIAQPGPEVAVHRFTLAYPRYGTIAAIPKDANGNDSTLTPTNPSAFELYSLGVTIEWVFRSGTDHPRIRTIVDLSDVPGPDRVNFDVRGPYGVMVFDNRRNGIVNRVVWGDRYHFANTEVPLTRDSAWLWRGRNDGARYSALTAGIYEMGLVEPTPFATSALADLYSDARGTTSALYNNGGGCPFQDQLLPCNSEWPYQSAQDSLPTNDPDGTTTFKKMAWGSAPFYGAGPSLPRVYDTSRTFKPFVGFPASKKITYSVCVVLGLTVAGGGLTRSVAAGPDYRCANDAP